MKVDKMISELFMLDMYDSYYKEIQEFYNKNYIIRRVEFRLHPLFL